MPATCKASALPVLSSTLLNDHFLEILTRRDQRAQTFSLTCGHGQAYSSWERDLFLERGHGFGVKSFCWRDMFFGGHNCGVYSSIEDMSH